jgi:trehalose 6-phosphate synthase/phosphatase
MDATVVAIGDDVTDEDMFRAVPEHGVSIAVGSQPTHAQYRLRDSSEVRSFLRELDAMLSPN